MTAFIQSHLVFATAPIGTTFLSDRGEPVPTGGLGWTPATFWAATLAEFYAAFRGRDGNRTGNTTITPAEARRIARGGGNRIFGEEH